jgi:hypothetical protein
MVGVQSLFPGRIILGSTIINIYAHYVGYIFGFVVPAMVSLYIGKKEEK